MNPTESNIKIDKELKALNPPLGEGEQAQLESNILQYGIIDPLITWGETLIDGHHRYEIARKHDLEFSTRHLDFDSKDEAKVWIIENQLGRRNVVDFVKAELYFTRYRIMKERGLARNTSNHFMRVSGVEKTDYLITSGRF